MPPIQSPPTQDFAQSLGFHEIADLLPYGMPWLLIDRLLTWDEHSITVEKVVSGADRLVASHFKNGPSIMPGVLQIELVNQAAVLHTTLLAGVPSKKHLTGALGRCHGHFYSPAFIGEKLTVLVRTIESFGGKSVYEGIVRCDSRLICRTTCIGALLAPPAGATPFQESSRP